MNLFNVSQRLSVLEFGPTLWSFTYHPSSLLSLRSISMHVLAVFVCPVQLRSSVGSCVVYEPLDRYVGRHLDRHIGRDVGRHIGRGSTDMSVDISTDMSVDGCWSSIGRYVDRYVDQYVGRYVDRCSTDTSVDIAADTRPIF